MRLEKTQGGGWREELDVQITSGLIHLHVELHEQLHKMQLKNAAEMKKYFSRLSERQKVVFQTGWLVLRLTWSFFSKLLTEALHDPETNQLVLINAALVLVWMLLTSGHRWLDRTTPLTPLEHLRAGMWVWSLKVGLDGKQQLLDTQQVCPESQLSVDISGIWKIISGLHWRSGSPGLFPCCPSAIIHQSPCTQETSLAKVNLPPMCSSKCFWWNSGCFYFSLDTGIHRREWESEQSFIPGIAVVWLGGVLTNILQKTLGNYCTLKQYLWWETNFCRFVSAHMNLQTSRITHQRGELMLRQLPLIDSADPQKNTCHQK